MVESNTEPEATTFDAQLLWAQSRGIRKSLMSQLLDAEIAEGEALSQSLAGLIPRTRYEAMRRRMLDIYAKLEASVETEQVRKSVLDMLNTEEYEPEYDRLDEMYAAIRRAR